MPFDIIKYLISFNIDFHKQMNIVINVSSM